MFFPKYYNFYYNMEFGRIPIQRTATIHKKAEIDFKMIKD